MITKQIITLALVGALTFSFTSSDLIAKGKRGKRGGKNIMKLDTDGNGLVSRAEVEESGKDRLLEHFDEIDANSDGNLSEEEIKTFGESKRGERGSRGVMKLDTDGDGEISKAEAEESGKEKLIEKFDEIDSNSDGKLSKEELKEFGGKMREKRGGRGIMKHLDKDNDGKISREEAESTERKKLSTNFNLIDANNDDVLTEEELKEFHHKVRKEKKK
jgi:Ca2+-binding EF-hand superfamily protein